MSRSPWEKQPQTLRRYARGNKGGDSTEAMFWTLPSASEEARALYKFMLNTQSGVEQIEKLICVSDDEFLELNAWALARPGIGAKLEEVLLFRHKVLARFRSLVEVHGAKPCLESTSEK
jgi:hypothetical protein